MIIHTSRIARACVIGFILCFSLNANANNSTQRWFDKGSALIEQNKVKEGISFLKRAADQGSGACHRKLAKLGLDQIVD